MKKLLVVALLMATIRCYGQNYILKAGDRFPDIILHPIINAPFNEIYLNNYKSPKFFIINFWGTWCSPCIPEMDALAKLQEKFQQRIQIIGYSNDPVEKIKKYNLKKPSKIWLASDTLFLLYKMFNLASVGHCAILDANKNIIAVVKTDSVNTTLITRLLKGDKIKSNAEIAEVSRTDKDPFGVDSLQDYNFTIRGYMKGQQTMGRSPRQGPYALRRKSYYNINLTTLYKDAYDINSEKEVIYNFDKKQYDDYNDKSQLYCFDLLVKSADKDSLKAIMRKKLNESLPIKSRTEFRTMPVYVLKQKARATFNLPESKSDILDYNFSGNGFDGTGVKIDDFAHIYLNNELEMPVVNETGLIKRYDIKTTNDIRDKENILKAVDKLGLTLVKGERSVKVLVLYK
jgi:uncharacterized protein (TIGR03435 family)